MDQRIVVKGEIDLAAAPTLLRRLDDALEADPGGALEIDFGGVTFIDSTALRALLNVRRRNRHMRIVNPSEAAFKLFEITGTVDYLVHGKDIFS